MERIQVPPLTKEQLAELEELYHKTNTPRYRIRAQIVLLSAEKRLKAEEIAPIVRESYITVLRWLKIRPECWAIIMGAAKTLAI